MISSNVFCGHGAVVGLKHTQVPLSREDVNNAKWAEGFILLGS